MSASMNAAEIIKQAKAVGLRITIKGGDLSLEAAAPPPAAIIDLIARHKAEIIPLLCSGHCPAETRVSWLDMFVAVENEAGRHRIWRDELTRQADDETLSEIERNALRQAIASHARDAAIFEAVLEIIERAG